MLRGRSSLDGLMSLGAIAASAAIVFASGLSGCGTSAISTTPPAKANASKPGAAVVGYVWDSRVSSLRWVSGALGAAHLEGAVGGSSFSTAVPCNSRSFALVLDSAGTVMMLTLPSGQQAQISAAVAKNERIVLSPSCSYALVYSPGSPSAALISGLPSAPLAQSVSLASAGSIVGAAVSDKGSVLLASLNADGSAGVQLAPLAGPPQLVKSLQRFGAMTFLPGGESAVLADAGANLVSLVTQSAGGPVITQLASSVQGVAEPLAASASADGHFAFVANETGESILRVDLTGTSAPASFSCACKISEMVPLFGNASFQLSDPAAGTIFALDGDATMPTTVFIPTDKAGAISGGGR